MTGLTAAGALPGAAQQAADDALAKVGISVPGPNGHSGDHSNGRGKSAGPPLAVQPFQPLGPVDHYQGLGHLEPGPHHRRHSADKGAVASDGKRQAGADHPTSTSHSSDGADQRPATTPSTVPPAESPACSDP
jgi:hypothetical protein